MVRCGPLSYSDSAVVKRRIQDRELSGSTPASTKEHSLVKAFYELTKQISN